MVALIITFGRLKLFLTNVNLITDLMALTNPVKSKVTITFHEFFPSFKNSSQIIWVP